jgi:hypothetical protein
MWCFGNDVVRLNQSTRTDFRRAFRVFLAILAISESIDSVWGMGVAFVGGEQSLSRRLLLFASLPGVLFFDSIANNHNCRCRDKLLLGSLRARTRWQA